MSEDFRRRMNRDWHMQRVWEAVEAYRDAVDAAWYDFTRELRTPCRKCGQWPCICREN